VLNDPVYENKQKMVKEGSRVVRLDYDPKNKKYHNTNKVFYSDFMNNIAKD
tara:strand:+ start:22681 stop:22833 length:153 start_codon:yes stop_codon:yes gene_type:complete